ncbi:uncharacterized protein LOC108913363 [Anoplophora glabripennis]|uniref:uncharacterized protein LOC108913363 n=1 Tax=Anoplophora glabripennis TaxID=217634 RepID=UPI000C76ABD8|nr:uncharacterized protein LOC108913363 [Anoplophora glabripennis]
MGQGKQICAKWNHIQDAYEMDNTSGKFRILHKLTDYHVVPSKLASKKMKVSYAAQVLSHSMASMIHLLTQKGITVNNKKMEESATGTAEILSFFDTLFDSVNGTSLYGEGGKKLKCIVSQTSGHIQFWRDARRSLCNMYFMKDGTTEKCTPPSLINWRTTLAGLEHLLSCLKVVKFPKKQWTTEEICTLIDAFGEQKFVGPKGFQRCLYWSSIPNLEGYDTHLPKSDDFPGRPTAGVVAATSSSKEDLNTPLKDT